MSPTPPNAAQSGRGWAAPVSIFARSVPRHSGRTLGENVRTVILNPDWHALLFWRDEQSQIAVDDAQLPISDSLRAQLDSFGALHAELCFGESGKPSDLDVRLLDDKGLVVWSELQKELAGLYRVVFCSHEFMEAFERVQDFRTAHKVHHG